MRQEESVRIISNEILKDGLVRAMFLKGSLARNQGDEYSDVDFYCIVEEEKKQEFLNRRIGYMEAYRPLIYWSESNFVGPQIVGVFDNGLHFDLYTTTVEKLQYTDAIKVLYDPEGLLAEYKQQDLSISVEDVVELYGEFSFSLLEFEAAYKRKDLIWASRLGSHLSGFIAVILRVIYDKENARLGFKRLSTKLDEEAYEEFFKAVDALGPSQLPKGVGILCDIAAKTIDRLPGEILERINKRFLVYMIDKIKALG